MLRISKNYLPFVLLVSCAVARGELITYKLIDGAAGDQAGHTISGTITLDPACASACTSLHSWEYTVSGPTLNRTVMSTGVGELMMNPAGLFTATPTELIVNFDPTTLHEELIFDLHGLAWNTTFPLAGGPTYPEYFAYNPDGGSGGGWFSRPSGRVTIATAVPEPGPVMLLGLLSVGYACRRRMKRKASSSLS